VSARVRSPLRFLAALGVLGMTLVSVPPAGAAAVPSPRPEQWYFPPWSIEQKVWPITQGQGVTVALLDGGVNTALPEVAGAVLPGVDLTGHGTDGHTDLSSKGHSTSMAGLIAGQGGGRTGLVGTAPGAKILPIAVEAGVTEPGPFATRLANGIRYAADHGAKVIAMPLGVTGTSACPDGVMEAVAYAVQRDVVLVGAAGNSGNTTNDVEFPGACPGVVAVGAIDDFSRPWSHTQSQHYVSVAAPGVNIPTTGDNANYYYPHSNGTSNSSALVAAAAALVRSANPRMPAREVVRRLIGTALDVSTPGRDPQTGYGVVRINRALDTSYAVSANSPNPPYVRFDQWQNARNGKPTATAPPTAAPKSGGKGAVVILVVVLVVIIMAVVVIAGILARRGRQPPTSGGGSAPQERPGLAWPGESPPPPGGNARPTFMPPSEDRPAGE
jgi:type VII secretion-associated serine protease mycosin